VISLSDVDDDVVDEILHTEEESKLKRVLWNNMNNDWLRAQKVKRRQKKEERKRIKEERKRDKDIKVRIKEEKRLLQEMDN
jgi:Brf1-like TBP-binding domain